MEDFMIILCLIWPLGAIVIGFTIGAERTIGFWGSFFISLIFSPVIGLLASLQYDTIEDDLRKKDTFTIMKEIHERIKAQELIS